MIAWDNPLCEITRHFTVREALWLPSWQRLAKESDGLTQEIKTNLIYLFMKMEIVRNIFNSPIYVHVAYRPKNYNEEIGGAKGSAHVFGQAVDWHAGGIKCDDVRKQLLWRLEDLAMRMEDNPGSSWVHLDTFPVKSGGERFFKP